MEGFTRTTAPPKLTTKCRRYASFADVRLVRRQVDGVIRPLLQRDDRELGAVPDEDLDVLRVLRRSGVAEDDGRARVGARLDHDVRVGDAAGADEVHDDRLGELDARGDADERSLGLLRPRDGARRGPPGGRTRREALRPERAASCSTPSGACTSTWMTPCGPATSSKSARSRSTGV